MIEGNVEGTRLLLVRLETQVRSLRQHLENYSRVKRTQDGLGQPLTAPQRQAHLTQFELVRSDWDTKTFDVANIIDAVTPVVVDENV